MKKWTFGIGLVIFGAVLIWVVFEKHIQSTRIYLMTDSVVRSTPGMTIVPQPYELQPSVTSETLSTIEVDTITVPVIFVEETLTEVENGFISFGEGRLLMIDRMPTNLMEGVLQDIDERGVSDLCESFTAASGVAACGSEFDFRRAVFSTTPEQTTWYSPVNQKVGYGILAPLKSVYGSAQKQFNTTAIRGFISETPELTAVDVFTYQNERYYQITFSGLTAEEIDYSLANIQIVE